MPTDQNLAAAADDANAGAVLGFGIRVRRHEKKRWRGRTQARTGLAQYNVQEVVDVGGRAITLGEYEAAIASGNAPFTHFLPLYIDDEHAARALPHLLRHLALACADGASEFEPLMALRVVPACINTVVVQMMAGAVQAAAPVLETYLALQRLLAHLCAVPPIGAAAEAILADFIACDEARTKRVVPSIGELLALLSVSRRHAWADAAGAVIGEFVTRNSLWAVRAYPALLDEALPTAERLQLTWLGNLTAVRLLMFHVHLLTALPPPAAAVAAAGEAAAGSLAEALQHACAAIAAVPDWATFLQRVGLVAQSDDELADMLVTAQRRSAALGYHTPR